MMAITIIIFCRLRAARSAKHRCQRLLLLGLVENRGQLAVGEAKSFRLRVAARAPVLAYPEATIIQCGTWATTLWTVVAYEGSYRDMGDLDFPETTDPLAASARLREA